MLELSLLTGSTLFAAHKFFQLLQKSTHPPRIVPDNRKTSQAKIRNQQIPTNAAKSSQIITAKVIKQSNQDLALAGTALGLAAAGTFTSHIIGLASLPPIIYLSLPSLRSAYQSVVHEQRIGAAVLQSFVTLVCLANGYYVAPALGYTLLGFERKLRLHSQQQAHSQRLQLFADLPEDVMVDQQGNINQCPRYTVQPGTQVVVEAGNQIPVDGVIVAGFALVSQQRLTGDAHPLTKTVGDAVFAASLLLAGRIVIRTQQVDVESVAGQIVQISQYGATAIPESASSMAVREQMAPYILGLGALAAVWLNPISAAALMQDSLSYESEALTPMLQSSFLTVAAQYGVLMRSMSAIATLSQIDTLVFNQATLQQPGLAALIAGIRQHHEYTIYLFTSSQQPVMHQGQLQIDSDHLFPVSSLAEESAQMQQWRSKGKRICYIGDGVSDHEVIEQAEIAISLHGLTDLADNRAAIILLDGSLQRLPYLLQLAQEFATQQNRTLLINYVAGLCGLASVLLFNAGVVTVLLLNGAGVVAGFANALLPSADYETDKLSKRLLSLLRILSTPTPPSLPIA